MKHEESLRKGPIIIAVVLAALSITGLVASVVILVTRPRDMKPTRNRDWIRVLLDDDITDAQRQNLESDIRRMPEVKSVVYVSKEQAFDKWKENFPNYTLDEIERDFLPAELIIRTVDPRCNHDVVSRIKSRPEISVDEMGQPEIHDRNATP
ncbi:MAG: permease-like cell division protein FtsX [Candidatus Geothermincolia bacterium]